MEAAESAGLPADQSVITTSANNAINTTGKQTSRTNANHMIIVMQRNFSFQIKIRNSVPNGLEMGQIQFNMPCPVLKH